MKAISKRIVSFLLALLLVVSCIPMSPVSETKVQAATTGFPVFDGTNVPDIYVDKSDYSQIVRAVGDLQLDVERVTTKKPKVTNSTDGLSKNAIIVGSVDKSSVIKQLINDGKLNEAKDNNFANKWESFVIKIVDNPMEGVDKALVIAGSDKRGGVFGIYDVSEQIGVSPWYYWGDIEPKVQNQIYITDTLKQEGEPSVRYRGIFLNDEQNLAQWAAVNDPKGKEGGNIGPETYKKVYELLLRLKSNYLWTAMHSEPRLGPTDHFNKYPENRQLANDYGVIVGTSHCEPMMRNGTAEWGEFLQEEGYLKGKNLAKEIGNSKVDGWFYNYNKNHDGEDIPRYDYSESDSQRKFIDKYWNESVKKYKDYECSYTLGMRGVHDEGFRSAKASSTDAKTKLLQQIVDSQIKMMDTNKVNEDAITIFVPYKEVLPLYQNGLKLPDETVIVWADDNHGFIRYFPTDDENKRSGGSGVYYHMNYVGQQTYIWLNSIPPSLVLSEMGKAYESGAKDLWVLNVGDIKPAEVGTEFFLQMAWDIDKWNGENIIDRDKGFFNELSRKWFPDADPAEVSDLLTEYYRLNYSRKPEHSNSDQDMAFDLTNYGDEFMQRVGDYQKIYQKSVDIINQLYAKGDYQAEAFYLTIGYPAIASYYNNLKWFAAKKSVFYKNQGRAAAGNTYAEMVDWAENKERAAADYYNKQAFGGKWNEIMDVYSVKYRGNQSPKPSGDKVQKTNNVSNNQEMGVVVEGESKEGNNSTLNFSAYLTDTHYLDIFAKGSKSFDYTISSNKDWVKLSTTKGKVEKELRVLVDIDWDKLPSGDQEAKLTIKGANKTKEVKVKVNNPSKKRNEIDGYAEANGYVAIEAEHYTEKKDKDGVGYEVINGLGRAGDGAVTAGPMNKKEFVNKKKDAPYLSYKVYFQNKGEFETTIYRLPTLDESKGQKFSIGVDDNDPTVLEGQSKAEKGNWKKNVTHGIEKLTTKLKINSTGYHTIKLYVVHTGVSVDRIIINTGGDKKTNLGPRESYHSKYNPDPSWTPEVLTPDSIKSDADLHTNLRAAKDMMDANTKTGIEFYSASAIEELSNKYTSIKAEVDKGTTPARRIELYNDITKALNNAKNQQLVKADADSNEDANKKENAIDFNGGTRWAAANSGFPRWYTVDLGKEYNLKDISISWFTSGDRAYKYKISTSTDGSSYQEVVDRSNNTQAGTVKDSLGNKKARYVKIDVSGSTSGGSASIYEIFIRSDKAPDPNPTPGSGPDVETEDNIALKKDAVATFEENGSYKGVAANAVDGDLNSRWSTSGGDGFPSAVQVDLGAIYQVDRTKTYWYGDNREYTYNIYVTDTPVIVDNKMQSGVTPVAKGLKGTGSGSKEVAGTVATEYTFENAAKGRYLTIEVTDASEGTAAVLWELQAFGDLSAVVTDTTIEAEIGTLVNEAKVVSSSNCSGGKYVGDLGGSAQAGVSFHVYAAEAGTYEVYVAYCSEEDRQINVKVNGTDKAVNCPQGTSWTAPVKTPAETVVELKAGENTVVFTGVGEAYAPNLDWVAILKEQILTPPEPMDIETYKKEKEAYMEEVKDIIESEEAEYTEESWKTFKDAYEAVNKAWEAADTTVLELEGLLHDLVVAEAALEKATPKDVETAKANLDESVEEVAAIIAKGQDNYTDDSWNALVEAYEDAKKVKDDASLEDYIQLRTALETAKKSLKTKENENNGQEPPYVPVPDDEEQLAAAKQSLEEAINKAEEIYSDGSEGYTAISWSVFKSALEKVKAQKEEATTVKELEDLTKKLTAAMEALNAEVPDGDEKELEQAREELKSAIEAASGIYSAGQKGYTEDSWTTFKNAYEAAVNVKDDVKAAELETLRDNLKAAQDGLKAVTTGPEQKPNPSQTGIINQVTVTADKDTLYIGGNTDKTAEIKVELPAGAAKQSVTYSTSDAKVANVDAAGKITATGKGTAVIKANVTLTNGESKAFNLNVTVKKAYIAKVKVKSTVKVGKKVTLKAKAYGSSKRITWKLKSGAKYAKLTKTGKFTAKARGKVKVVAKSGKISKTFTIRVK